MNAETLTAADIDAVKHPFERAGLGRAPFRFVGMVEKTFQSCPGAPIKAGGCCDYCSNGIRYVFNVRSADGKTFGVGSECIRKVERADNRLVKSAEAAERAFKRKQAQAKRDAARPKELARIADARSAFESNEDLRAKLAAEPHPFLKAFRDWETEPKTLLDYVDYMFKSAGHSGRLKIARMIEKQLGNK